MTAVRCPECDCFINSFQLKNDNCWSCGNDISILKPNTENDETNKNVIDEVEEKANDRTKSLSQKTPMEETNKDLEEIKESNQKNNYPVLKVISRIYNFLALLMVLASIISFVILLINMDDYGSNIVMLMIGSILSGVIGYIILNGISEVIILFVDIANDVRELKDKHLGKI